MVCLGEGKWKVVVCELLGWRKIREIESHGSAISYLGSN